MLITLICCNYYNYLSNSLSSSLIYDDLWLWEFVFARTDLPRSPSSKALISATTRLGAISPSSPVRPKTVLELKRFSFAELQHFGRSSLVWRRFKFPIRSLCWYAIFWMSHEQNNFKGIPKKKAAPQGPLLRASNFRTWASFTLFTFTWASTKLLHSGLASLSHIMSHYTSLHHFYTTIFQNIWNTLWLFNIAMGNGPFIEVYLLKKVIFHGYVK